MAEVKARPNESFEKLYRRFTRKVQQAGLLKDLKKKRHYLKPSEKKKIKQKEAEKRRRKKNKR